MSERTPTPYQSEIEERKAFRRFVCSFSPILIATGFALQGLVMVAEAVRIADGDFNTVPRSLKDATGHEEVPSWFVDAVYVTAFTIGATGATAGLALRRATRDDRNQ